MWIYSKFCDVVKQETEEEKKVDDGVADINIGQQVFITGFLEDGYWDVMRFTDKPIKCMFLGWSCVGVIHGDERSLETNAISIDPIKVAVLLPIVKESNNEFNEIIRAKMNQIKLTYPG